MHFGSPYPWRFSKRGHCLRLGIPPKPAKPWDRFPLSLPQPRRTMAPSHQQTTKHSIPSHLFTTPIRAREDYSSLKICNLKICNPRIPRSTIKKAATRAALSPLANLYFFAPFNISSTRSKSSSVAYSITIFPLPRRSRIRTRTPRILSSSCCVARTFGSTQRALPVCSS